MSDGPRTDAASSAERARDGFGAVRRAVMARRAIGATDPFDRCSLRLIVEDSTLPMDSLPPPPPRAIVFASDSAHHVALALKKASNKSARAAARRDSERLAASGTLSPPPAGFGRVLVDAECTHDGSIAHVGKLASSVTKERMREMLCDRGAGVAALQLGLVR